LPQDIYLPRISSGLGVTFLVHYFTPEEANRILPEVKKLVSHVVKLKADIDHTTGRQRNQLVDELGVLISRLEDLGVELKDTQSGLADFPAKRFGEPVYLCWKLGEPEVMFWHEITGGFMGRKTLKPEPMKQV
jgi:hypothetical protein